MNDPELYQFDLVGDKPALTELNSQWYPGIEEFWESCTSTRRFNPVSGIRAVVIHATAGGSSAGALWGMKNGKSSFHWLVPDEDEAAHGEFVWRTVPHELAAWHVQNKKSHPDVWEGNKLVNHWSIGIELVNRQDSSDGFSAWQLEATAEIVRYCWAKYPNLKHVVSHAKLDPGRRSDPGELFDWEAFRAMVLADEPAVAHPLVISATPFAAISASSDKCCNG